MITPRRIKKRDPRPLRSIWPVLAALVVGVVVVGLAIVAMLRGIASLTNQDLKSLALGQWSDTIRSVGFAAAAMIAVPVGYVAYRRQRTQDAQHVLARDQHTLAESRDFRDRFVSATGQLGGADGITRLAGAYALANLADEWGESAPTQRQMCIDVLCAYLRTPHLTDDQRIENATRRTETFKQALSDADRTLGLTSDREIVVHRDFPPNDLDVRLTIITLIADHLKRDGQTSWQGLRFNLRGATIPDGADFSHIHVEVGTHLDLSKAIIPSGMSFNYATFSGGTVSFGHVTFPGGVVWFEHATFSGGAVLFSFATFSGSSVWFNRATFSSGLVWFNHAIFSSGSVTFEHATFSGSQVSFDDATFSDYGRVRFDDATFSAGRVRFEDATFNGGEVTRDGKTFRGWPEPTGPSGPDLESIDRGEASQ